MPCCLPKQIFHYYSYGKRKLLKILTENEPFEMRICNIILQLKHIYYEQLRMIVLLHLFILYYNLTQIS